MASSRHPFASRRACWFFEESSKPIMARSASCEVNSGVGVGFMGGVGIGIAFSRRFVKSKLFIVVGGGGVCVVGTGEAVEEEEKGWYMLVIIGAIILPMGLLKNC